MIAWPKRLIVFWAVVAAVSVPALIRGLSSEGESGAAYTALGLLGITSVLVFIVGWIRQSRQRR